MRYLLITVGWLAVFLGVLGIVLPLLPTTPFLLLAASCFAKSSERFHNWLLTHPLLGPYLKLYLSGNGIPAKTKVYILILLWGTMSLSAHFFVPILAVKLMMMATALAVSVYILRLPTANPEASKP